MNGDIRDYGRLGLVYFMLYPHCMEDPDYHVRTLLEFARRTDIETLDCCIPYDGKRRESLVPALKNCGKEIVYAAHLFPLRKISLASVNLQEQDLARLFLRDQIPLAAATGSTGFILASGADVPEEDRPPARQAFADFCRWFCRELKPYDITALLEPFDRTVDKKFLYGPTRECVDLIESLRPENDNFGIELDMAHLPLMGESFASALKTCAPCLKRIHLGNCVLKDKTHPWYGDLHPPIGLEGGEIDVPQLVEIFRLCLEYGYLDKQNRGALVMEMRPFPGKTEDETVQDNIRRIEQAWKLV